MLKMIKALSVGRHRRQVESHGVDEVDDEIGRSSRL